ncbi:hypothetical protein OG304_32980 [Streptomyces sp. NBC_00160]|uniref:hypothetical protein n=1 Tax=Streptomyces TaxID=1883 RepID=UPI0022534BD9|nr:hypothetical protein [Streptomyces sp. NBC_00160]MCX5308209.1 hypothetical protein [Streptomyces sp. NBC_00160]
MDGLEGQIKEHHLNLKDSVHAALLTAALISGTAAPAFAVSGGSAVKAADQVVATVQNATGTADVAPDSTRGVMATD